MHVAVSDKVIANLCTGLAVLAMELEGLQAQQVHQAVDY